jgi:hypothetical protein
LATISGGGTALVQASAVLEGDLGLTGADLRVVLRGQRPGLVERGDRGGLQRVDGSGTLRFEGGTFRPDEFKRLHGVSFGVLAARMAAARATTARGSRPLDGPGVPCWAASVCEL